MTNANLFQHIYAMDYSLKAIVNTKSNIGGSSRYQIFIFIKS